MAEPPRQLALSEFPELLHEIPDPPKTLSIKGAFPSAELKLLAVVGSREYTSYGKEAAGRLIAGLRGYPVGIVSGLAIGIDGIAHKAALDAELYTMAIPGSGLGDDVLYPRAHTTLAREILENGGALLSEFPEHEKAAQYTFPQRNRIMAGITHATLVIEAAAKSGTLITARLAADYNRDVLTVPGSIFSKNTEGPHMLIRNGAVPVTKSEDVLEALGIEARAAEDASTAAMRADLSEREQNVCRALSEPRARDELIVLLAIPAKDANILLATMELKGVIVERFGKIHLC